MADNEFAVGQRVVTTFDGHPHVLQNYYGHVTKVDEFGRSGVIFPHRPGEPLIWVNLKGRVDGEPVWDVAIDDSWPFWRDELEHAD